MSASEQKDPETTVYNKGEEHTPENPRTVLENDQDYRFEQKRHKKRSYSGSLEPETVQKAQEFVIFMYMATAVLLGFRFILSMLGANIESPFVAFIYDVTYPPMLPFDGMFGRDLYRPTGYTLEFEIIVALVVYGFVFYGFNRLIAIIFD